LKAERTKLRLICELMTNCRRSDRELATAVGISQPTVTRMRRKLEDSGFIKEYAAVPDFKKLGFNIMAFTFIRYREEMSHEEYRRVKSAAQDYEKQFPTAYLMALRGSGLNSDRTIVTFHEDYASYTRMLSQLRQLPLTAVADLKSFLVNLDDTEHYRPLTLSKIVEYLLTTSN